MSISYLLRDPFEVEKIRDLFAERRNERAFKYLYTSRMPAIRDINSSKFWNNKLTRLIPDVKSPMGKHRKKIMADEVNKLSGNYLSIGFGTLDFEFKYLKKHNFDIYGLDVSDRAVKKATMLLPEGDFRKGVVWSTPYQNNFFDVLVASEIMEHVQINKTFKAWSEMYRIIRHEGFLVVSVPINEGLETMVLHGRNPNGHLRCYSSRILDYELELSGFHVVRKWSLYAFRNFYGLKTKLANFPWESKWQPNNLIVLAKKR